MGHGKSVCDAIGGTVKRNAERAVKCGILIRNAHEFYEWAKNSNSQIDFIWCSKNDEISKVEKEIKKLHKPKINQIMKKHVIVQKDGELYSRETPCWKECCYSESNFLLNCEGWFKHEE